MRPSYRGCVLAVLGAAACMSGSGCQLFRPRATETAIVQASAEVEDLRTVYIVSNGWHAGLMFRGKEIPLNVWPEARKVSRHDNVEVGWGDEGFYRAKQITAGLVFDAAFLPSAGVLHIAGTDGAPEEIYQGSDLVKLEVTPAQLERLCEHIHAAYARNAEGEAESLGPGIYGDSAFYRTDEKYYFPKTCNVWTARGLKHAGLPVAPSLATTADGVLWQVRRIGRDVGRRKAAPPLSQ